MFLPNLATLRGGVITHYQAEYAKQWHKKFNPNVEQLAEEAQLPSWIELRQNRVEFEPGSGNAHFLNPDLPTLTAWEFINRLGDGQRFTAERNPYYWKVDTAGNQLPYNDSRLRLQLPGRWTARCG
ncbi:MAG: hypothetical protein MI924_20775 [Chloroflexales bacterium]|nr:hypothetical protein [Chloroflexales bacterium]